MIELTTQQRREYSKRIADNKFTNDMFIKYKHKANKGYVTLFQKDSQNRLAFLIANSNIEVRQLEYMYTTGKKIDIINIKETYYIDDEGNEVKYYDAPSLEGGVNFTDNEVWFTYSTRNDNVEIEPKKAYNSFAYSGTVQTEIDAINNLNKEYLINYYKQFMELYQYYSDRETEVIKAREEMLNAIETYSDDILLKSYLLDKYNTLDLVARASNIENYLTTNQNIYEDRYNLISLRIKKQTGTLRSAFNIREQVLKAIDFTMQEANNERDIFSKYFIVKKIELNGEKKRRIFIEDPNNDIKVGDWCYILTDNEDVPELYAQVDVIINGKILDTSAITANYAEKMKSGNYTLPKKAVKKIFFKKPAKITAAYSVADNLRLIKMNA